MQSIEQTLADVAKRNQKALIGYIMAGYPDWQSTISAVRGLVRGGADIIELGFPFSDPLADGPTIQDAGTASLAGGTTMNGFLDVVRKIRTETDIPLVLMTYANILYKRGFARFASEAGDAGINGIILPDMSIEEAGPYLEAAGTLDTIFLVSPNTKGSRIREISKVSSGFLYMVAVYGTTGAQTQIMDYTIQAIKRTKRYAGGQIPVGVGFGVSTPADVKKYVKAGADAVIVGSAFLRIMGSTPREEIEDEMAAFTRSLKRATITAKQADTKK